MRHFFLFFTILFFVNFVPELWILKGFQQRAGFGYALDANIMFYYICSLSVYSYYNIGILVYRKDITGLLTFFMARLGIVISRTLFQIKLKVKFAELFIAPFQLSMYVYLYYKWDGLKSIIFRSYTNKIGTDTSIRKLFVLRSAYCAFQSFTLAIYTNILFMRIQYKLTPLLSGLFLYLSILPVFFSLVVKRFETEKEDTDAKLYAFCSYILTICLLTASIHLDQESKSVRISLKYIMSANLVHFVILAIFCGVDYFSFGKGLKEAFESKKQKSKL